MSIIVALQLSLPKQFPGTRLHMGWEWNMD